MNNKALLRGLAQSIDPVAFMRGLGFEPDPWQKELLLSTDRQVCLNCSRQSGKTETVSLLALFEAINTAGSLILILSPSQRQSQEMLKKVHTHLSNYRALGNPISSVIDSATQLQLSNGSRIVSLPGQNPDRVRGFSGVNLLLVDEAARCSRDLYYSCRPMMAVSQGRVILLSTPAGKSGFFWETFNEGDGWKRFRITADDVPRIDKSWLIAEKRAIGERWWLQEFYCEFMESEGSMFSWSLIERAFSENFSPIKIDWDSDGADSCPQDFDALNLELEESK
jgi:Terminase large subunit, T4likevirus-type, N-terminal